MSSTQYRRGRLTRPVALLLMAFIVMLSTLLAHPGSASAQAGAARMTAFNPGVHGFRFSNGFTTTPFQNVGLSDWRFGGLCGGMSYAALDYFFHGKPIPRQLTQPATGTPLYNYIYQRQETSLKENADKWLELIVNPFGWRTTEFFNWGLQGFNGGRLQELRREIDAGRPAPLGLFKGGNGGAGPHHQVVAIGYDMGQYAGDLGAHKEDLKIFVYDPNYPGEVITMVPRPASNQYQYLQHPDKTWQTYFVDLKYRATPPPTIDDGAGPYGDKVSQLQLHLRTGGDDLRGGNATASATVHFRSSPSFTIRNLNNSARWISHYDQIVYLQLPVVTPVSDITGVTLNTTLNGDNWDVDYLAVRTSNGAATLFEARGTPLVRFTGINQTYPARIDRVVDGGFEDQTQRTVSAPWWGEGPDAKGMDIDLGYQHAGRKNGFIWTTSRNWNALGQAVPVIPHRNYVLRGWIRTSANVQGGYFGVRAGFSTIPHTERQFTAAQQTQYRQIEIPFNPGANHTMTVFAGYWGPGTASWAQMDNFYPPSLKPQQRYIHIKSRPLAREDSGRRSGSPAADLSPVTDAVAVGRWPVSVPSNRFGSRQSLAHLPPRSLVWDRIDRRVRGSASKTAPASPTLMARTRIRARSARHVVIGVLARSIRCGASTDVTTLSTSPAPTMVVMTTSA